MVVVMAAQLVHLVMALMMVQIAETTSKTMLALLTKG
jgi:hypothetical protein